MNDFINVFLCCRVKILVNRFNAVSFLYKLSCKCLKTQLICVLFLFCKCLNVDERVSFLTDCVLNVFQNFVPNMVITVRNKDALWMTPEIKKMILEKAKIYRRYVKHGRNAVDYLNLRDITARCRTLIKKAKDGYFSRLGNTLNNPDIGPKKYWSILHCFLNKRKTPKIPPIRHNNAIVTNITEKANIFNIFFARQCSLLETNSVLPAPFFHYSKSFGLSELGSSESSGVYSFT